MDLQSVIDNYVITPSYDVDAPDYCIRFGVQNNVPVMFFFTSKVNNSTYPYGWYNAVYYFRYENGLFFPFFNNMSSINSNSGSGNYLQGINANNIDSQCVDSSSLSSGGGNAGVSIEYSEFWFPVVSIIAFCFIVGLLYKIIIKRLLP